MYTYVYKYIWFGSTRARDTYSSEMCLLWVRIVPSPRGLCVHIRSSKEEKTRFDFFLDTLRDDVFTASIHTTRHLIYIYILYSYIREDNYKQSRKCETRFLSYTYMYIIIYVYNWQANAWAKYVFISRSCFLIIIPYYNI